MREIKKVHLILVLQTLLSLNLLVFLNLFNIVKGFHDDILDTETSDLWGNLILYFLKIIIQTNRYFKF